MSAVNVTLSFDERDAIDTAQRRIRAFAAVLSTVVGIEEGTELLGEDKELCAGELAYIIYEDAMKIEAAFQSADKRKQKGGAR